MFENLRRKIGEAIEKIEDGFKNVITLGKHEKIKEHARQYENILLLLKELHSQHEDLVVELKALILEFEEDRIKAFEACQRCQALLMTKIIEISISFPELKPPPENNLNIHLDGVLNYKLQEEYKSNNVGAASKGFLRYVASHKAAQQQVIKHPMIAAGAAAIDGINGLISATKAATAQLNEIIAMQSRANSFVYQYRNGNSKITILIAEISQDRILLNSQVNLLEKLKLQLLNLHNKICINPSKWKKIIRWWRKLFRFYIFSKKELKELEIAKSLVVTTLSNIEIILQKNYNYNE